LAKVNIPDLGSIRCLLALAVAVVSIATGATAELYRCVRPDGSTVYTDSRTTCPGAREHQTTGEVQNYRASTTIRSEGTTRRPPASLSNRTQTDNEASWRQKKLRAAQEFLDITARIEQISPFVKTCNRGGSVFRTQENGLRTGVSCDRLRDEVPKLEKQRSVLEAYLDHGLRDECRRSGCLPGWLR
jgi:hypothetical protein